jgi:hypothetical protein
MTHFYPWPDGDGEILYGMRLLFGSAMVLFIALAVAAIRRRGIVQHSSWMMRGYAIGLGAGTQVLITWAEPADGGPPFAVKHPPCPTGSRTG